ncbi:multidrug resistance protein MdtC [Holospora obtusa F1]|uniref:Multidrug resistance protein MdtC n=1 Tax=Holospora obtusa F1 TaxID=1399147 RepID=W6TUZ0_HOLOB|nr:efflux RND transporter permease subunit [Holospora obtusa]ETZ07582.1 multidrug resistance protein MdtC [Holospora obtusa F1]
MQIPSSPLNPEKSTSSFTDFFIDRPVFSWVVNIIMVLLGIVGFFQLSTRQYPIVERPSLTVRATFSGAARVIEEQITKVLEESFVSLQSLSSMRSEVQKNESNTWLIFEENRSMDAASADVREILSRVNEKLPENSKVYVTKGNSNALPVMELVVQGEEHVPLTDLYAIASRTLKGAIESVPGVAVGEVIGGSDLQMKITLDREKLYSYHIGASELSRLIKESSVERALGYLKEENRQFSLTAQSLLSRPEEFAELLVPAGKGAHYGAQHRVRLGDLAKIHLGQEEEDHKVFFNGRPVVAVQVIPQPNSNPINISKLVYERLERIKKTLPKDIKIHVALDKSIFIKRSINQVYRAIFESIILVLIVIFIFLRSFSSSLVPLITIPISLISTFFIMNLLGFSINVLSLLAMVLAIGLVVDDAIVVLENVYRYLEQGKGRLEAARLGCREIRFSVIAMTLTLAAVYAPISLIPGTIGKMFKEFALTLAGAVLISGVVALTLSPSMCSVLVRAHTSFRWKPLEYVSKGIDTFLEKMESFYVTCVSRALNHMNIVWIGALSLSVFAGWVYTGLKKELIPASDEGIVRVRMFPPSTRNLKFLEKLALPIDGVLKGVPETTNRLLIMQMGDSVGRVTLKPWEQRTRVCQDIVKELDMLFQERIAGAEVYSGCVNSSPIGGRTDSAGELEMVLLSDKSSESLRQEGRKLRRLLKEVPGIDWVDNNELMEEVGYNVKVHRDRISQLGLTPEEIFETLRIFLRGTKVSYFEKDKRMYDVVLELPDSERDLEKIPHFFIKGRDAKNEIAMVPLRELVSFEQKSGDSIIYRTDRKSSYTLKAYLQKGASALSVYEEFERRVQLPTDFELRAEGELRSLQKESGNIYLVFGLAIVFIFLVMSAQFESFLSPFIIMITVPLALAGGVLTLAAVLGMISIYGQIGLITLIGLITKHGILLVDFADQARKSGLPLKEAILEGCRLRLRPILMTTLAMVLGSIPLAFAQGPGYEARQQIGWVITGGMTIGTLFTLFVIPCVLFFFMKIKEKIYKIS